MFMHTHTMKIIVQIYAHFPVHYGASNHLISLQSVSSICPICTPQFQELRMLHKLLLAELLERNFLLHMKRCQSCTRPFSLYVES